MVKFVMLIFAATDCGFCYTLFNFNYRLSDLGYTAYSFQLQTVRLKYLIKGNKCFQKIITFFIVGKIYIESSFLDSMIPKGITKLNPKS
jgi:hypothetical protein